MDSLADWYKNSAVDQQNVNNYNMGKSTADQMTLAQYNQIHYGMANPGQPTASPSLAATTTPSAVPKVPSTVTQAAPTSVTPSLAATTSPSNANINGWFTSFMNRAPTAQEDQYWQQQVAQNGIGSTVDAFSQAALQARGNNLTPFQTTQWNNLANQLKSPVAGNSIYQQSTANGTNTSLQHLIDQELTPDTEGIVSQSQRDRVKTLTDLYNSGGPDAVAQWYKAQGDSNAMATMQTSNIPGKENGVQDGGTLGFIKDALPIMAAVFGGGYALSGALGAGAAGAGAAAGSGTAAGTAATAGGAAAAGGTAAAAGGLAAAGGAASAAIPTVSVVGAAGGAGGLSALGTAGALGAGAVGLGTMLGGGTPATTTAPNVSNPSTPNTAVDPNIPQVVINGNTGATGSTSLGNMMNPTPGTAGALLTAGQVLGPGINWSDPSYFNNPINGAQPDWNSLTPVFPGIGPTENVPHPSDGSSAIPITLPGGGSPSGSSLPSLPSSVPSLTDLIKGIGTVATGYTDYKMNQADKDYYQQLMDKMMGMYNPGTPEAGLMEQKMRAQDAAAGRNSQYGIRAQNLAAMLADQRAKIMTSPTFEKMAEASRGHYDSSLASLSSMLGSAGTSGNALNSLINYGGSALANSSLGTSISDWFKAAAAPER